MENALKLAIHEARMARSAVVSFEADLADKQEQLDTTAHELLECRNENAKLRELLKECSDELAHATWERLKSKDVKYIQGKIEATLKGQP